MAARAVPASATHRAAGRGLLGPGSEVRVRRFGSGMYCRTVDRTVGVCRRRPGDLGMRWARCRCGSDAAAGIHSITRIAEYRGNPNLRTEFGCAAPISPARTQHNHRPSLTIPWPEYVSSQQPSSWAYTCSSYSLKPYRSVTACGCVQRRACYRPAAQRTAPRPS
jgi:hypothetical protein